jgi:hypothetical protein
MKIRCSGSRVVLRGQTDEGTDKRRDRHDKEDSRFTQFCESTYKSLPPVAKTFGKLNAVQAILSCLTSPSVFGVAETRFPNTTAVMFLTT